MLPPEQGYFTVGVLVQANYGAREELRITVVPVGADIPDLLPEWREISRQPRMLASLLLRLVPFSAAFRGASRAERHEGAR